MYDAQMTVDPRGFHPNYSSAEFACHIQPYKSFLSKNNEAWLSDLIINVNLEQWWSQLSWFSEGGKVFQILSAPDAAPRY